MWRTNNCVAAWLGSLCQVWTSATAEADSIKTGAKKAYKRDELCASPLVVTSRSRASLPRLRV